MSFRPSKLESFLKELLNKFICKIGLVLPGCWLHAESALLACVPLNLLLTPSDDQVV